MLRLRIRKRKRTYRINDLNNCSPATNTDNVRTKYFWCYNDTACRTDDRSQELSESLD